MNMLATLKLNIHLVNHSEYLDLDGLKSIVDAMKNIWLTAEIEFTLVSEPDHIIISEWPDLGMIANKFEPSPDGTIQGFYGNWEDWVGNELNGWSCPRKRLYFVRDFRYEVPWTPPLQRVSSHEIGHILGLGHYNAPKGYLMTSNDPGTALQQSEVNAAYKNALAIADLASK